MWNKSTEHLPEHGDRFCLCFSPSYSKDNSMRWRILQGQFVKLCSEVVYWKYVTEFEKEMEDIQ